MNVFQKLQLMSSLRELFNFIGSISLSTTMLWTLFVIRYLCVFRSDATCIICREEMTTAKKLLCGHLFHVHCLRSWLERQHTCPTCRAPIIPPDNGRAATARQNGAQQGVPFGELPSVLLIFFLCIFLLSHLYRLVLH